ncbi:MAG TPA: oligopeptide transporter, OPT family [Candidatus Krumholzibacteria bacterium]|nr:oligopeptide transporter, OPT family [Candidatus Krumholzibacteria bacterium]HPD72249.1 oligopeptide transporter, OPT family [Candidatus Krumholzibacteria bacterium]HRY40819.1 oligopeptide transporter, OPT family [Candidatus Krumholzibacteria bacterium]
MTHESKDTIAGLPANARRPLEPGERYVPVVPDEHVLEVTGRSVTLGLVLCAVFAVSAAYVALKLGQGIEAAIPIAILGIGYSGLVRRRSTMLENVFVQSIGANSSHVVSGAVFTIPALYMLAAEAGATAEAGGGVAEPAVWQVIVVSFLGGCLGILFLIPLRHHFMVEMHGKFPWPEATATTEIVLSGERAGGQARVLALAAGLGALYDGLVLTLHAMAEQINFRVLWIGQFMERHFLKFSLLNNAAVVGVGYIIGLRYAAIICAGSFLASWLLVPMVYAIGKHVPVALPPGPIPIGEMGIDDVFKHYVRIIGVGGIAGAGLLGILQSLPAMIRSIGANLKGLRSRDERARAAVPRTDRTLPGATTGLGVVLFAVCAVAFFTFGLGIPHAAGFALAGTVLVVAIAFLFAPVSARAIAIVGTNPVSGMTMLTLIVTGLVMKKLGLTGGDGMFVTMMVGGVVCTALAAAGALASDLKVGHWIGATPAKQLALKFVGTLVAAVFCGLAMWLLAKQGDGFGSRDIPAPQASAMKTILVGIFGTADQPLQWLLFGLGAVFAVVLRVAGVPALAFALGMYLPMEINTPVLLGGVLSWVVQRRRKGDPAEAPAARHQQGILIASGLIAGGALMGVLNAGLNVGFGTPAMDRLHVLADPAFEGRVGEGIAIVLLAGLCWLVVRQAGRARPS